MAHPAGEAGAPLNIDSAASAIDNILNPIQATDEAEQPVDDAEPNEAELLADDADDEAEEPETGDEPESPAIDPPVSWKADDKAVFATLPPAAQRIIADRESERERFAQSKATEAADAKRTTAQAETAIQQLHAEYTRRLEQFAPQLPAEPDAFLLDSDPVEYLRQERAYRDAAAQYQAIQQEYGNATQAQQQMTARNQSAFVADQDRILAETLPGWNDPAAREKITAAVTELASAHGFKPEQLESISADEVIFLHNAAEWKAKADRFDKLQADKMTAVRAAKELPRIARPGAAAPQGAVQAERINKAREQFGKRGDLDSGAALLRSMGIR